MAELSATNPTSGGLRAEEINPAEAAPNPPRLALRLAILYFWNFLLMLPVSGLSGVVTCSALISTFDFFEKLGARSIPVAELVSVLLGVTSGALTFLYFAMQFDFEFAMARLRGTLHSHPLCRCPGCQTALDVGQVVCADCGKDLRGVPVSKPPATDLQRFALASYVLATIPLANGALLGVFVVTCPLRDSLALRETYVVNIGQGVLSFAAAGWVTVLRASRAMGRWRLLNAELAESGAERRW